MIYRRISDRTPGREIASGMTGDRITMKAVSSLDNSSADYSIDEEGAAILDRTLIRNGVVENSWGHRRFCQYLGLEDSSVVRNFVVEGGAQPEAEVRRGDYLEVVEYSAFHVDSMGGDIAGEIRLGYLHQNGTVRIVSGGSVSGNIRELMNGFRFSKETRQYDCLLIPSVTRLQGVTVTGA